MAQSYQERIEDAQAKTAGSDKTIKVEGLSAVAWVINGRVVSEAVKPLNPKSKEPPCLLVFLLAVTPITGATVAIATFLAGHL